MGDGSPLLADLKNIGEVLVGRGGFQGLPISVLEVRDGVKETIANLLVNIYFLTNFQFVNPGTNSSFICSDAFEDGIGVTCGKFK